MIKSKKRLLFIDNLRSFLIALIILNHAGNAYFSSTWWFFKDSQTIHDTPLYYFIFKTFNVGLFFFLSAYLLYRSHIKYGSWIFLKKRMAYYFKPLIIFILFINPFLMYFYHIETRHQTSTQFFTYLYQIYFGFSQRPKNWGGPTWPDYLHVAHLWYIEFLILFTVCYVVFFEIVKKISVNNFSIYPNTKLFFIILFCFFLPSFILKLFFPTTQLIEAFGFLFILPYMLPYYVGSFVLGIIASKCEWDLRFTNSAHIWIMLSCVLIFVSIIAETILHSNIGTSGGFNVKTVFTTAIESLLAISISISLLYLFNKYLDWQNWLLKKFTECSYFIFFIHIPIIVFIQYSLRFYNISPLFKILLTTTLAVVISFYISVLLLSLTKNKYWPRFGLFYFPWGEEKK